MQQYRKLTDEEVEKLKGQGCTCGDFSSVQVAENFNSDRVKNTHFSGSVKLGAFDKTITLFGGMQKATGVFNAKIHNSVIGNNVYINNVADYIANYVIEDDVVIENIDLLAVDGNSTFGNGTELEVLIEAGGRELLICDGLSAQAAYIMGLYRHRPKLIEALRNLIGAYSRSVSSSTGRVCSGSVITHAGTFKNIKIGPATRIDGASWLENGSINSTTDAPVLIGTGVIAEDFIISSGTKVTRGAVLSKCFLGQGVLMGKQFSAENSLFFANCECFHGEGCAVFAGPYSVTHHKSTLLIAGMFSFYNAGSGTNESNHMYKLGPVHQGILERGCKTASSSHMLWPVKLGPFCVVVGKGHIKLDTSNLPFSYIFESESEGQSLLIPAMNLATVGTLRDIEKWPARDRRKDPNKIDLISFQAFSPFTVQKMIRGVELLTDLKEHCDGEYAIWGNMKVSVPAMENGIAHYQIAVKKYLGDCLVARLNSSHPDNVEQLRAALRPERQTGAGRWVDLFGLLAPEEKVLEVLEAVETGRLDSLDKMQQMLREIYDDYEKYEWTWVAGRLENLLGGGIAEVGADEITRFLEEWKVAVESFGDLILQDARKEFSEQTRIGFGIDGDESVVESDFQAVRGTFEDNKIVSKVTDDVAEKKRLADELIAKIAGL